MTLHTKEHQMHTTIDIETVENPLARKYPGLQTIKPAGNVKDPAKQEASIAERRQKMVEQFPLHWPFAQVVCISAIPEGQQPQVWYGEDEVKVLSAFGMFLSENPNVVICGKSTADFDVPVLAGRFIAHDLGVPDQLRTVGVHNIRDVDHIFGYSHASGQRGTLNEYAWGLQYTAKLAKGNDVASWYALAQLGDNNAWTKITEYCIHDSEIANEVLKRWKKPFATTQNPIDVTNLPF